MGGLGGIGALIAGTAVVKMIPDFRDFDKETEKGVSKAGSKLGAIGGTLTKAVTLPIAGIAVAGFKMASDLNEAVSASNATFGEFGTRVTRSADEMNKAFGTSRKVFLESATGLGAIFKASGLTQEAATDNSIAFTKLAADLSSFKNIPMEEALNAIRSGLVGEAEPLRRHGVLLSEAAVQQEAARLGLKKLGGELTEAQKVQARSSLITKGLADANGDLARTADQPANVMRKFTGRLQELAITIGQKLLPIGTALLGFLIRIFDVFSKIPGPVQTIIIAILGIVAAIGPLLIITAKLVQAFQVVKAAMVGLQIASLGPILIWVAIGAALVALVVIIVKNWDTIKSALIAAWEFIRRNAIAIFNAILDFFKRWGPLLLAIITGPIGIIVLLVIRNWDKITAFTRAAWNAVVGAVRAAVGAVSNVIRTVIGGVVSFFSGIWNTAVSAVRTAWNTITSIIRNAVNAVMGPINAVKNAVDWLLPGSPVPFVVGVTKSAEALKKLRGEMRRLEMPALGAPTGSQIAASAARGALAGVGIASPGSGRTYNLTVESRQSAGTIRQDFALMEALAG